MRVQPSGWTFFNAEKSERCAVLEPQLRSALAELKTSWPQNDALSASVINAARHAEVRAPDADGRPAVYVGGLSNTGAADVIAAMFRRRLGHRWLVAVEHMSDSPWPSQRQWLTPDVFGLFPLGRFQQINTEVNRLLVAQVVRGARRRHCQTFLDLFAGAGNFALPLSAAGLRGTAIEISTLSTQASQRAAAQQGLDDLECRNGRAADCLRDRGPADLVVVDPPRAGLGEAVASSAEGARRHIALCSCNPRTLVADLDKLRALGFQIDEATAFDMFPHTKHVEVLVWLQRRIPSQS